MPQQNDDSALTNLRDLMQLENERVEAEKSAQAHAAVERQRRAADERSRAQAEAMRRARDEEEARIASQRAAREIEAQLEAERADRELRVRLEVEQQRRVAKQSARLAHEERMAQVALSERKRVVSTGAALGLLGLAVGGLLAIGAMLTSLSAPARPVAFAPSAAADPSRASSAALAQQIADANREAARLQSEILRLQGERLAPLIARPARPGSRPSRPAADAHGDPSLDNVLGDLDSERNSPINGRLEGAASPSSPRRNRARRVP